MKTVQWTLCLMIVYAVVVTFPMTALAADTDALVVDETGNVGIGTSSPLSRIHVVDSGNQTALFTGLNAGTLRLYGGSYVQDGYTNLDFSNNGTGGVIGRIGVRNNGGGSYLTFGTSNNYSNGITNQALIINPSGNVGIGTANPAAALDISTTITPIRFYRSGGIGAGSLTIDNKMTGSNSDMVYQPDPDGSGTGGHAFYVDNGSSTIFALGIDQKGKVGIGTTSPSAKLHVHGTVYVKDSIDCFYLTTRYNPGADFVFEEEYDLPDLGEVKAFIEKNKHLPEIPSAAEMQANGVSVSEMLTKHLQKIEELTLYMIDLQSDNTKLQSQNGDLRALVHRLEERLSKLETRTPYIDEMNN